MSPGPGQPPASLLWGPDQKHLLEEQPESAAPAPVSLGPCALVPTPPNEMLTWLWARAASGRHWRSAPSCPRAGLGLVPALSDTAPLSAETRPLFLRPSQGCKRPSWEQSLTEQKRDAFPTSHVLIKAGHRKELYGSVLISPKDTGSGHPAATPRGSQSAGQP